MGQAPHQQDGKTLWKDEELEKEKGILAKVQSDGVWMEMEKDFKAKQLMINLMGACPLYFCCSHFR